mgnify:CR=1 FL=1
MKYYPLRHMNFNMLENLKQGDLFFLRMESDIPVTVLKKEWVDEPDKYSYMCISYYSSVTGHNDLFLDFHNKDVLDDNGFDMSHVVMRLEDESRAGL